MVTSGGQAEFGRALGGYINVVTKSGTNALHGDLYGYFRNQRFNAANPLSHDKLPLTQAQYGASLGGPIVARPHLLLRELRAAPAESDPDWSTIAPANVAAINTRLAASRAIRGPQITTGLYPNPVHNTNFLGKVDHQFSANDQFSVRYSLYDVDSSNSRGAGGLSAPSASSGLDNTRPDHRRQQHRDAFAADGASKRAASSPTAICRRRPRDLDRPGGEHFRRRLVRQAVGFSHRARQQAV